MAPATVRSRWSGGRFAVLRELLNGAGTTDADLARILPAGGDHLTRWDALAAQCLHRAGRDPIGEIYSHGHVAGSMQFAEKRCREDIARPGRVNLVRWIAREQASGDPKLPEICALRAARHRNARYDLCPLGNQRVSLRPNIFATEDQCLHMRSSMSA